MNILDYERNKTQYRHKLNLLNKEYDQNQFNIDWLKQRQSELIDMMKILVDDFEEMANEFDQKIIKE